MVLSGNSELFRLLVYKIILDFDEFCQHLEKIKRSNKVEWTIFVTLVIKIYYKPYNHKICKSKNKAQHLKYI